MQLPLDTVLGSYELPMAPYPFQVVVINDLSPIPNSGLWMDTGTGKTLVATVMALFKLLRGADIVIVTMPPILITRWARWLRKIKPTPDILMYRGSPKKRKSLKLAKGQFVLMSQAIFKRDYDEIRDQTRKMKVVMIVDEATCLKNVESDNYQMTRDYVEGHEVILLSGTPLSTPMDAYAYTKLLAPHLYRSFQQFQNIHVGERDFFDQVVVWNNLDLLNANMKVNAVRILKTEVLKDLPDVTYDPIFYEMDPKHYKLYQTLSEERLLPLANGGKIDATVASKLHHALQQIVCNWGHFADDPSLDAKAIELVEETLEELGDRKLIVFASYQMTNRLLLSKFGKSVNAVAAYGEITVSRQQRNIDYFIDNPSCRLLIGQPTSMGVGVDGLQQVCCDGLFLELPQIPKDFHQAVARLWRDGQHLPVNMRIAVAEGTLQVRKMHQMLDKDSLVNRVIRSYEDLRASIFGG